MADGRHHALEALLMAQAFTLNAIFARCAEHAARHGYLTRIHESPWRS